MATTSEFDASPDTAVVPATAGRTNTQRVATGLGQSVVGPFNVARGVSGLGATVTARIVSGLYSLIRRAIARGRGIDPDTLGAPSRKPLIVGLIVAAVLAAGGLAFKLLRTPKAPPVAPAPPRVRPTSSGATGDSAPVAGTVDEHSDTAVDDDPRKRGE